MSEHEWRTTSTIIDRLQKFDDRTTWNLLVEHFREPVIRLGVRMGLKQQDAQDAAQETLIAFADSMRNGKFDRSKGRLASWLFGIAHRQALNARTSAARRGARTVALPEASSEADAMLEQDDPAEQMWEEEWRASIYKRALRQLQREVNARTFEIFGMSVIEGRPLDEVTAHFDVAESVVYNTRQRLAQRIKQLRGEYEDA